MRIASHASDQYRKNSTIVERQRETKRTEPQASVKTTTFGFRLGKFGVDVSSSRTVLDPSLSRDVREKREKAQAFKAEAEVESLRAKVGTEGAAYRDLDAPPTGMGGSPAPQRVRSAMAAYAQSSKEVLPPPGNMLAAVV